MPLDQQIMDQDDLHSGQAPWYRPSENLRSIPVSADFKCEVLIVGAGITGSVLAEALTREGRQVCILERERPGAGSTSASTAMLLWEIDNPLRELSDLYGFEKASRIYRRSFETSKKLNQSIERYANHVHFHRRRSLLLAAKEVSPGELLEEHKLRNKINLPVHFLDHRTLLNEFEISRASALVSEEAAEADPVLLSGVLLQSALARGARLLKSEATAFESTGEGCFVKEHNGFIIEAEHVVLATGYSLPSIIKSDLHKITSSWAAATAHQSPQNLWRQGALIWEASKNYLYSRTTSDGRIVIGGEDDSNSVVPEIRDAQISAKAEILMSHLKALWPRARAEAEFKWAGAFGTTTDGLPLLGAIPGYPNFYAAYGYGGNGITFSFLAAQIVRSLIRNERQSWFDDYALDR